MRKTMTILLHIVSSTSAEIEVIFVNIKNHFRVISFQAKRFLEVRLTKVLCSIVWDLAKNRILFNLKIHFIAFFIVSIQNSINLIMIELIRDIKVSFLCVDLRVFSGLRSRILILCFIVVCSIVFIKGLSRRLYWQIELIILNWDFTRKLVLLVRWVCIVSTKLLFLPI